MTETFSSEPASLRDALIDAGTGLLAEGGMAALTLRRAAARAGVSHAAPAHHFDGLPGLLTAIAARAFQTFAGTLHTAREAAGPDALARLLGTTHGYLRFAVAHQGLFHLMFVSPEVNRADPALAPHAARSYNILREACQPFTHQPDPALELAVWSMVHGYAALGFCTETSKDRPFAPQPAFPDLLAQLLAVRQNPAINPLAPAQDTR
jgi:AcrR family transcriptional regulator